MIQGCESVAHRRWVRVSYMVAYKILAYKARNTSVQRFTNNWKTFTSARSLLPLSLHQWHPKHLLAASMCRERTFPALLSECTLATQALPLVEPRTVLQAHDYRRISHLPHGSSCLPSFHRRHYGVAPISVRGRKCPKNRWAVLYTVSNETHLFRVIEAYVRIRLMVRDQ